jgi:hypothetical protein
MLPTTGGRPGRQLPLWGNQAVSSPAASASFQGLYGSKAGKLLGGRSERAAWVHFASVGQSHRCRFGKAA